VTSKTSKTGMTIADAAECIATLAAFMPGQVPTETAKAWISWLAAQRYSVETTLSAIREMAPQVERVTLKSLREALDAAHQKRLRALPNPHLEVKQLDVSPEERKRITASSLVIFAMSRLGELDNETTQEEVFQQLKNLPTPWLLKWSDELREALDKHDAMRSAGTVGTTQPGSNLSGVREIIRQLLSPHRDLKNIDSEASGS